MAIYKFTGKGESMKYRRNNKYRNEKVKYDGRTFDSQKECQRYMDLKLLSMKELGHKTGGRSSRRKLIYDIDNQCFYKGTREAAVKLHTNRQTISDYCNGKIKKPMFNLRWARADE